MKDLTGVLTYEKLKNGTEAIGIVKRMLNDGNVEVSPVKTQVVPIANVIKTLRAYAEETHKSAQKNKAIQEEMKDMTLTIDNGYVESARIIDDGKIFKFVNDEFKLGPNMDKQIDKILNLIPKGEEREKAEMFLLDMIDHIVNSCGDAFGLVMGYAQERLEEEFND